MTDWEWVKVYYVLPQSECTHWGNVLPANDHYQCALALDIMHSQSAYMIVRSEKHEHYASNI